jgi:tRNA N6-adenosine threonylcarbamoyltransferase
VELILPVVRAALEQGESPLETIEGIAVTTRPGLIGSLLVGVSAAKALAYARSLPIVGVHHLEGHIFASFLAEGEARVPCVALIASGGHTELYYVRDRHDYELMGTRRDDAAGEAFDKVSKLIGLGYPGGPAIDRLAQRGDKRAIIFPLAEIKSKEDNTLSLDFSFSGLKTAVLRHVRENKIEPVEDPANPSQQILDLCASFQNAVVRALIRSLRKAAEKYNPKTIILAGGVACNTELRAAVKQLANELNTPSYIPSPIYTTDNAAMIAAAGFPKLARGECSGWEMSADVSLRLQNVDVEDARLRKKARYRL